MFIAGRIHTYTRDLYLRYMRLYTCNKHIHVYRRYGVALVSRIDNMRGPFRKRALYKRLYSVKETDNLIDPSNRIHRIVAIRR